MRGRTKLSLTAILVIGLTKWAGAAPPFIEWVRSEPSKDAVVDFRVATRSHWQLSAGSGGIDRPDLRVEIFNHSNTSYLFPNIGAGWLTLERADGQPLKSFIRARQLRRIDWLLVAPGENYTALCEVEVKYAPDGQTRQLTYTSADGTMFTFEPMTAGKYKLHFRYEFPISQTIGGQPPWAGKAETGPVEFEIAE